MGLTKQYLRYEPYGIFNLIGGKSNIVFLKDVKSNKNMCAVGACENVIVWDLKKGEKACTLYGNKHQVTMVRAAPRGHQIAVGYEDGSINVFDLSSGDVAVTFSGHKSAVTALTYDHDGMRLVSGAMDTEVIVWDVVNESGLFRLKGHKGIITQARFMHNKNILITSSKDTFVKFWDLETQHCFKTLVSHRTEVWDFVLTPDDQRLISGSTDMELRLWNLTEPQNTEEGNSAPAKKQKLSDDREDDILSDEDDDDENEQEMLLSCTKVGNLQRQGKGRVISLSLDPEGRYLGCHGSDNQLELYRFNSEEEVVRLVNRRQKKARKRAREQTGNDGVVTTEDDVERSLTDEVARIGQVKMASKIRSFDVRKEKGDNLQVVSVLGNNTIESCTVDCSEKKPATTDVHKLAIPGHRSDVRTLCFSSDNTALMSASGESVKIWNRATLQCIRTMSSEYALCCLFAPGDRHVVIGCKSGKIQVFDIAAGSLLETVDAHTGAVWSLCLSHDKKGLVSGSADKTVKFWEFELVTDPDYSGTSKRLTLVHTRTLQLSEDVLCVRLSPDGRLIAASLLDNTIKVFFVDSLKFFLSLYGHKLPVLCMDISADSTLLITGSADRNCKIWGLDFGDCHKSIFAHDDSIMCIGFVAKTHMFFTGGKDKTVKEWDADNFEHIQTLQGHHAEVWSLAVSPSGTFLASASHDKSMRVWERTSEPLVLDEEREMEREREAEQAETGGGEQSVPGEPANPETGMAGKKTIETVKAAERLMEALELYREEEAKRKEHEAECEAANKPVTELPLHPMFQAFNVDSPAKYMLEVIKKVKSSELEESLLVLPFSYVTELLQVLNRLILAGWEVELCCRCAFFLLRIHQGQITSNQVLLPVIDQLRKVTTAKVNDIRDVIGFNLAGLRMLARQVEERESVQLFADVTAKTRKKRKKKRAILAIKTV